MTERDYWWIPQTSSLVDLHNLSLTHADYARRHALSVIVADLEFADSLLVSDIARLIRVIMRQYWSDVAAIREGVHNKTDEDSRSLPDYPSKLYDNPFDYMRKFVPPRSRRDFDMAFTSDICGRGHAIKYWSWVRVSVFPATKQGHLHAGYLNRKLPRDLVQAATHVESAMRDTFVWNVEVSTRSETLYADRLSAEELNTFKSKTRVLQRGNY